MRSKSSFKKVIFCFMVLILMILVPLLAVFLRVGVGQEGSVRRENIGENCDFGSKYFRVLDESDGKIFNIPDRQFVYGVVTAEMPARFEPEAIKAQAVASYTYFCRERNSRRKDSGGTDYDFKVDTKNWKNYVPEDQMKVKWGDKFDEYYAKIRSAVDSVFGEVIENDGELILAAYHAMSSGVTEKSSDVFGGEVKYLTNVESVGDKLASGYETKVEVDVEQFKKIMYSKVGDIKFDGEPKDWVGECLRTEGGMVKNIMICSKRLKGTDMRKMFALRSSDFDINYNDEENKFIFTVRGYGHGVGMSQQGAQYMAKNGDDYKKILAWYYPGTSIIRLDE